MDVLLSPLIDCVFLLLIFFLVTSMIKRFERQVPVVLADSTAAVAAEASETAVRLGLDTSGRVYRETGRDWRGVIRFEPVDDLAAHLNTLGARSAPPPIELIVEQGTPFQSVIDTLDVLQLQGFENVRSRVRDGGVG